MSLKIAKLFPDKILYYTRQCTHKVILRRVRAIIVAVEKTISVTYRGADKSLARPGRKQSTATEDFDVHISFFLS
jgi:hypothetical protein